MEIDLYKTLNENNKVTKTLTDQRVLTGTLKEEMSVIDPVVLIEGSYPSENYAYIPTFGKYYFIKKVTNVRNNLWRLEMHEDVLMTYSASIRALTALVERQQNNVNPYIVDTQAPLEADSQLYMKKLGGSFNTKNNLVIVNSVVTPTSVIEV